ncbi:AAA family ATPase [Bacillus sp. RG28]|uniref:AAA family ATPase n=1 Tax=Gottfriedia endophytica TaxID=2820819 RepID=A0A940NP94_9BACI|nr:AAA family ATPase [Gottfriedia endophytica]MBP0725205.1 AAA family ATPase [Gottfriedia endophytica]
MRLKKFSVLNYKVFNAKFSIDFSKENIVILTGRNNTGKSTFLEAINQFYLPTTAKGKIPVECYSNQDENNTIELEAEFVVNDETGETITIIKKYSNDNGKYYDKQNVEIKRTHELKETLDEILANSPYYITPYMTTEEIDKQVQEIYSQIITAELSKLEMEDSDVEEIQAIKKEYLELKSAIPKFLKKLKGNTDSSLSNVSTSVSNSLQSVFSNNSLQLSVYGGESTGFTVSDIVKSTSSSVLIGNNHSSNMPLSTQGTGIQRMSLIYMIQNMIEQGLMGTNNTQKMLLIDEPEAFLHPEAVRALSKSLYSIGSRMPLIISTHSPVLIDLSENHTTIQVFRIGKTEAIELFQSSSSQFDDDDIKNMKLLNYVDSYVNEFFFADKIIVVEGDTEYVAFKHFIKERGLNIHVIRARGKATICSLMKILNQFNTSYYILHDIDNHERFENATLKQQQTNCYNIYALKNDSTRIFGSVPNLERSIGLNDVHNSKKTETIHRIIHDSVEPSYIQAREKIEKVFNYIFRLDNQTSLEQPFIEIVGDKDYENLFNPLLSKKQKVVGKRVSRKVVKAVPDVE